MIKIFQNDTLIEGIDLVLKNRLFISGWNLSKALKFAKKDFRHSAVETALSVLFINGKPIALCYRFGVELQCFCKKSERRKGYASKCIKEIKKLFPETEFNGCYGIEGSHSFWGSNNMISY